jgi:Fe-Mn family superoxide dismutase
VLNQAGQHYNHILFWQVMQPGGGGDDLPAALKAKIDSDLGGLAKFKEDFKQAGVTQFGSGWAWLVIGNDGKLKVTKTPNGANPLSTGEGQPILGVDVWEHAYYLDFRNVRPNYLQNFLDKLVNWEVVADLMAKGGLKTGQSA